MARKKESGDNKIQTRREAILKLVSEKGIGTQKDLAEALSEAGFEATQATLSRDIRELKLVKTAKADGTYSYQLPGKEGNHPVSAKVYTLFTTSVVRIETALNQVVIHTYTGMAQAICTALDGFRWSNVLGTIAGDDTILVITRSEEAAQEVARDLKALK